MCMYALCIPFNIPLKMVSYCGVLRIYKTPDFFTELHLRWLFVPQPPVSRNFLAYDPLPACDS